MHEMVIVFVNKNVMKGEDFKNEILKKKLNILICKALRNEKLSCGRFHSVIQKVE